jgi:hypothetical protein
MVIKVGMFGVEVVKLIMGFELVQVGKLRLRLRFRLRLRLR